METISVNGETFIKANILARELGYTADYVGQLCRGGKVKAELVGRSWYVEPSSLRVHKKSRYRSVAKKTQEQIKEEIGRRTTGSSSPYHGFAGKLHHPDVQYYQDQNNLLPVLSPSVQHESYGLDEKWLNTAVESDIDKVAAWSAVEENDGSDRAELEPANETAEAYSEKRTITPNRNLVGHLDIVSPDREEAVMVTVSQNASLPAKKHSKKATKAPFALKFTLSALIPASMLVIGMVLLFTESRVSSYPTQHEIYQINWENYQLLLERTSQMAQVFLTNF